MKTNAARFATLALASLSCDMSSETLRTETASTTLLSSLINEPTEYEEILLNIEPQLHQPLPFALRRHTCFSTKITELLKCLQRDI